MSAGKKRVNKNKINGKNEKRAIKQKNIGKNLRDVKACRTLAKYTSDEICRNKKNKYRKNTEITNTYQKLCKILTRTSIFHCFESCFNLLLHALI